MTTAERVDFEKLFGTLPDRYLLISADAPTFTLLSASDEYLKATNTKRSKIIGRPLFEVFPDTTELAAKTGKGAVQRSLDECIKTAKPGRLGVLRYDIPSPSGEMDIRYWEVENFPMVKAGKVTAILQRSKDVTSSVQDSEATRLLEIQLEDALANESVGAWMWQVQEDIIITDKRLARALDMDPAKALKGMPLKAFMQVIHPDDVNRVQRELTDALKKGDKLEIELRTFVKGKTRWAIGRGRVERDKTGRAHTVTGVIIDITDLKTAQLLLLESEEQMAFMAEAMPQLVWTTDASGNLEYFNKRWLEFTGMPLKGLNKLPRDQQSVMVHPDDRPKVHKAWQHAIETGKTFELEYRIFNAKIGSYVWIIGRSAPYRNDKGKIIKWYGTCTEIDTQKRSAQIQRYLARVSKELSTSLDYQTTLKKISQLCVPEIADWCSVDLYSEEKGIEQVSVAHTDPSKLSLAKEFRVHNPVTIDQHDGVAKVIRTGETEFHPVITCCLKSRSLSCACMSVPNSCN
jgi:PAS domain S-box-containing protein